MTKSRFTKQVKQLFLSMGLKVVEPNVDCNIEKPDLVAIYLDTQKYYLVEVISDECVADPYPRLIDNLDKIEYNRHCKKIFKDNDYLASIASSIFYDLSYGLEAFDQKFINEYELNGMTRYATIAVSEAHHQAVEKVLDFLDIEHRGLDVIDRFYLILISKEDTEKLLEKRLFRTFLKASRG